MGLARLIQPGVEEVAARMSPATHRDDPAGRFLDHRFVGCIGIRLQITAEILEELGWPVPAARIAIVIDCVAMITLADVRPELAGPCRIPREVQHSHGGLIGVDHIRLDHPLSHQLNQRAEQDRTLGQPAAERASGQEDAVAGQHVLLAIQRQVIGELVHNHVRQQSGCGQATLESD